MPLLRRYPAFCCVIASMFIAISHCLADTLTMDNGDRLTGKIVHVEKNKIEFNTTYAGDISIDVDKVRTLESDQQMTLEIDKTEYFHGTLSGSEGHLLLHPADGGPPIEAPVKDSGVLIPGRVSGREWKYSGHINIGASDSRGNTVVNRTHLDSELIAQNEKFRITAGATLNRATDHNTETESNALANFKYDRFISPRQYGYGNITLEHDSFKDIKLRNTIGAGRGYDFIARPRTNLALEGGLSYVYTDFYSTTDDNYPAVRLALRFDHFIVPRRVQVFHQSEVFIGIEGLRKSFAHSKTGLRFPLRDNFIASLEYDVDWDADPAPGSVTTDRNLLFTLGYRW